MDDNFLYEVLGPIVFFGIISFVIAEFFGRAKHIGFWWSFFLSFSIIPGILAVILSPNANKEHTKGGYDHWTYFIIFLLVFLFHLGSLADTGLSRMDLADFVIPFNELIIVLYLYNLARGNVFNENPKFYFGSSNDNKAISVRVKPTAKKNNKHLYFIEKNNEQIGPLTYEQLKLENINKETEVWRKGLINWVTAKELDDLSDLFIVVQQVDNTNSNIKHKYFIYKNNEQLGPLSYDELRMHNINGDTDIWRKGLKDWATVKELDELSDLINELPPAFNKYR